MLSHSKVRFPAVADSAGSLTAKPKAAQLDGFIDFRPAPRRSVRSIAFGAHEGVSRVDFSGDGGLSWYETELGKDEGDIQFPIPTMADARTAYKAQIEPKDVDAIVEYLISIRGAN